MSAGQILHRLPDRRQVLSECLGDVGLHRSGRRRLPLPFRQHHAIGVMGQADLLPEQLGGVLRSSGSSRFCILGMVPLFGNPEPASLGTRCSARHGAGEAQGGVGWMPEALGHYGGPERQDGRAVDLDGGMLGMRGLGSLVLLAHSSGDRRQVVLPEESIQRVQQ